jgi:hypothetical protein
MAKSKSAQNSGVGGGGQDFGFRGGRGGGVRKVREDKFLAKI